MKKKAIKIPHPSQAEVERHIGKLVFHPDWHLFCSNEDLPLISFFNSK